MRAPVMGDVPAEQTKRAATKSVKLRVRLVAHVDVADLDEGTVSKTMPLVVAADVARDLLERHPYLEATEG